MFIAVVTGRETMLVAEVDDTVQESIELEALDRQLV